MSLKQTLKLAKQLENQAKKSDASPNSTANLSALKDVTKPRNHVAFNPLLKKAASMRKTISKRCERKSAVRPRKFCVKRIGCQKSKWFGLSCLAE